VELNKVETTSIKQRKVDNKRLNSAHAVVGSTISKWFKLAFCKFQSKQNSNIIKCQSKTWDILSTFIISLWKE